MNKTLILTLTLIAALVFTSCTQPEFVTDKSDNMDLAPPEPVVEMVTIVDTSQETHPDGSFGETIFVLVEDENVFGLYKAQIQPDGSLIAGDLPFYTFQEEVKPMSIDHSAQVGSLLVQTETTLYELNINTAELTEITALPEHLTGKALLSPYQEGHLFYTLSKADEETYLVDAELANSVVMDLIPAKDAALADVSEDATLFIYQSPRGFSYINIAENTQGTLTQHAEESMAFGQKVGQFKWTDLRELPSSISEESDSSGYDVVIKNGIVFEPESKTIKYGYDIGIIGDSISLVTHDNLIGEEIIDATGLVVAPGFIDMLSFNPNYIGAKYKIGDGVTTNLSMHGCTNHFDDFFSYYERNPVMVNYGGAVFMYLVRLEAGIGRYTEPTDEQVAFIAQRTREEIEAGGLALAFSPEYYPGTNSDEISSSMAVAKEYDLASHFHARYSALTGEKTSIDSVIEVLDYARQLDAHVHFMHLHSTGGTGCMEEAIAMINEARDEGYKVTFDIYPYDSWATNIGSARFDGDWQSRFGISYEDLQIAGTTDFVTPENFQQLRNDQRIIVAYAMDNDEVIMGLQDPQSMIGSDSIVTSDPSFNHFRASGAFTRFLGHYIRDLDIMPLMEGIRKTSYNTAHQLEGISDDMKLRGRLTEGTIADITVFDYSEIIDTSSAEVPASLAEGISYVTVSGHIVKDLDKIYTDRRYGQPIANNLR